MFLLFVVFEGAALYGLALVFFARESRLATALTGAVVVSVSLSVIAALATGSAGVGFPWYAAAKSVMVLSILALARARGAPAIRGTAREFTDAWVGLLGTRLGLGVLLLFGFLGLCAATRFPLEWDSYSYHLPLAADFMKHGVLSHYQYYGNSVGSYYPHAIELLYSVYFSLCGIERCSLVNFPGVVLLFLALFLIGRDLLKLSKEHAVLGALVFLFLPFVRRYFFEAYVDIFFLSFGLLAVYFLARLFAERESRHLLIVSVLTGLLLGTKSSGLLLAPGIAAFSILACLRLPGSAGRRIGSMLFLALGLCAGFVFYLFNALHTGNPFFPLQVEIRGIAHWSGHYQPGQLVRETSVAAWIMDGSGAGSGVAGLRAVVGDLSVGLLAILAFGVVAIGRLLRRADLALAPGTGWLLGLGTVGLGVFAFTPFGAFSTTNDFVLCLRLAGLFLAPAFLLLLRWAAGAVALSSRLLKISLLLLFAQGVAELGAQPLLLLCLILLAALIWRQGGSRKWGKYLSAGALAVGCLVLNERWHEPPFNRGSGTEITVAYAGSNRHFQLYDQGLRNNLLTLNVNRMQNLKWDRETDLSFYKTRGNHDIWLRNMLDSEVDFLVLFDPGDENELIEKNWIARLADVFLNEGQDVYRVDREGLLRALGMK